MNDGDDYPVTKSVVDSTTPQWSDQSALLGYDPDGAAKLLSRISHSINPIWHSRSLLSLSRLRQHLFRVDEARGRKFVIALPVRFKPAGADLESSRRQSSTETLYILGPDNVPRPAPVTAGLSDGSFTAISGGGVQEGNLVIVGYAKSGSEAGHTAVPRGPAF